VRAIGIEVKTPSHLEQVRRGARGVGRMLFMALACGTLGAAGAVDYPLRWRWSNPAPHGGNVVDMAYSPSRSLAVQVAERGQIYTSSDLDLWLPRDSNLTNALRAVAFFGTAQRIVITGEKGAVLYADDEDHFQPGTLLDGPTSDWLEAVTASTQLLVAAGDNGAIYTSSDGAHWKRQDSGTNTWFRGAATGAGSFVVVGEGGAIYTSPNGTNWSRRASGTTSDLNRVGFGNGRFTAVGVGGVTVSSLSGGTNWFVETPGATNDLEYVVTGGFDRLLDGRHEVRIHDGLAWSNELAKTNGPPDWSYYTALGWDGFFLIAGQGGMQSEGYQNGTQPYFWLTPYASIRNWLWDVMRLPSFYVTVGDYGTVMTSGNGVDWSLELVPAGVTNTTFLGVGGNTNLLLAVGDSGTIIYSPNLLTNVVVTNQTGVSTQTVSTLGVLWHRIPGKPTTNSLQGVGVLSNSLYVVTGNLGTLLTSTNGTNWATATSGTTSLLSSVTEWPGGLIAVGDNGTIVASTNGVTWGKRTSGTTNWLFRVRWLNGALVAVGQAGTILSSSNGTTWTNRTSGTTNWLTDAEFVGDTWFVLGLNRTVLTSTNLVHWINRGTLTRTPLYAAATDSKQLILVGGEGAILRSPVVPDLTPVSILDYARFTTNGSGAAYNLYLFGGKPDQRFTLDRATNVAVSTWVTGPQFEIFDGSGTLYYLETVSGTNLPPVEFYRTQLR
jgi:hypothetical protein